MKVAVKELKRLVKESVSNHLNEFGPLPPMQSHSGEIDPKDLKRAIHEARMVLKQLEKVQEGLGRRKYGTLQRIVNSVAGRTSVLNAILQKMDRGEDGTW